MNNGACFFQWDGWMNSMHIYFLKMYTIFLRIGCVCYYYEMWLQFFHLPLVRQQPFVITDTCTQKTPHIMIHDPDWRPENHHQHYHDPPLTRAFHNQTTISPWKWCTAVWADNPASKAESMIMIHTREANSLAWMCTWSSNHNVIIILPRCNKVWSRFGLVSIHPRMDNCGAHRRGT